MYLKSIAVNATGYGVILDVYPNGTDIRFVDTTEVGIGRVELTLDANRCKHYVEVTRKQFDQITNGLTVGDATPVSGGYIRQRWHTGEHKDLRYGQPRPWLFRQTHCGRHHRCVRPSDCRRIA